MLFKGQIFLSTQKRNTNDLTFQKKKKKTNEMHLAKTQIKLILKKKRIKISLW